MKKLFFTLAMAGLSASAFAQGTVSFGNQFESPLVGGSATGVVVAPGNTAAPLNGFTMALYAGTAVGAGVNPDTLVLVGIYHDSSSDWPQAGFFAGPALAVTGTAGGANAFLEVAGWTGSAASWDAAISGGASTGFTGIFSNPTGNPTGTPPTTPSNLTGWNGNLTLTTVTPEPATLALLGLGAAGLLFFRRKK